MHFFRDIFYLAFALPGIMAVIIVLMIFGVLLLRKSTPWYRSLTQATLATYLLYFLTWAVMSLLADHFAPYMYVPYIVVICLCAYALRRNDIFLQKIALPISILIFFVIQWQTTGVRNKMLVKGEWYPHQGRIAYKFQGSCAEVKSEEAIKYLKQKESPGVELELDVIYEYGAFAGYEIQAVDGKYFKYGDDWIAGCKIEGKSIFSRYSLALRGFSLGGTWIVVNSDILHL